MRFMNIIKKFWAVPFAYFGAVCTFFKTVDTKFLCLLGLMAVDFITGGIILGILKKSGKTEYGGLSSKAGMYGLVKKVCIILCTLVGFIADILLGTSVVFTAVVIGFCCNEIISILENVAMLDIKIPALNKALKSLEVVAEKDGASNE